MVEQATTVRVLAPTHRKLAEIAAKTETSITQVVADAVDIYERHLFWERFKGDVDRLRADPQAWADHQAELALWDRVSADGLEELEDEDWSAWEEAADGQTDQSAPER
jgi:hypothetical protein